MTTPDENRRSAPTIWAPVTTDDSFRSPVSPGPAAHVPPGEDLDLQIGWDRFERLVLDLVRGAPGLRGLKFRRYGVQGQAQQGIDLAGRDTSGRHTVVQCKDYREFTVPDLRNAVTTFAEGTRPFGATHFIIATSASTQSTRLIDEYDRLCTAHPDLELDLWGSEELNHLLRSRGDVVARFWSRETASAFCTSAPVGGVPVPSPDRHEQAERILIGPLQSDDVAPLLRSAETAEQSAPAEAARLYGELARRLRSIGFRGHAGILHRRQIEALAAAEHVSQAIELTAALSVTALHHGDHQTFRELAHRVRDLGNRQPSDDRTAQRHAQLVSAALHCVAHPLDGTDALQSALEERSDHEPDYRPRLVLLLGERLLAAGKHRLDRINRLITDAIDDIPPQSVEPIGEDVLLRLRLLRAEYDASERRSVLRQAQGHRLPHRQKALVLSREGRRRVLEGLPEEAAEAWRDAVHEAILAGLDQDAADWLYAVRSVNAQFGPVTTEIDEEHRLAQALRIGGGNRLLERSRSAREQALSAVVRGNPIEAVLAARNWLTDAVVSGDWTGEDEASGFLGRLYRDNQEPDLAAEFLQRAGQTKELTALAAAVGDRLLPQETLHDHPWWVVQSTIALIEAQQDLLPAARATELMSEMLALTERGRAGELTDSPFRNLTFQLIRSTAAMASRSTAEQAVTLLGQLAADVARGPNQYSRSDKEHAHACVAIAAAHPSLTALALNRLFDLAEVGADEATKLLVHDDVLAWLSDDPTVATDRLTAEERKELRLRIGTLDDLGQPHAHTARAVVDPGHPQVQARARAAVERILNRPEPVSGRIDFGTRLVEDSFLVSLLRNESGPACTTRLMAIAVDIREPAMNRRDVLTALRNLVEPLPAPDRHEVFEFAVAFATGRYDKSRSDDLLGGKPHPLSSFKFDMGSASLRGPGLLLAGAAARETEDHTWLIGQAIGALSSEDTEELQAAAVTLNLLPLERAGTLDASLLAAHPYPGVRQLSAILCARQPAKFLSTARQLAADPEHEVRCMLAEAILQWAPDSTDLTAVLEQLAHDPRHSVRTAATR